MRALLFLFLALQWPPGHPMPAVWVIHENGRAGNGCFAGAVLWTAAHVATVEDIGAPIGWEAGIDRGVIASSFTVDEKRDLAWTIPGGQWHVSAPIAKRLPVAGERLWLVAILSNGQKIRLQQYAVFMDGDFLLTDGLSWPGMSGSCLMNEQDEVVGINSGSNLPVTEKEAKFFRPMSRWGVIVGRLK